MNHGIYITKQLLIKLFVEIPVVILGYPVVAIALLFRLNDTRRGGNGLLDQRLPQWAAWWDNGDDLDRVYGLNGDLGYQSGYPHDMTRWQIYRMRYTWLALRNPANYFGYYVLGASKCRLGGMWEVMQYPPGVEIGDWTHEGKRFQRSLLDDSIREYYLVKKYKSFPERCLRIRIGYKIPSNEEGLTRSRIQRVFVIQPWKQYRGV